MRHCCPHLQTSFSLLKALMPCSCGQLKACLMVRVQAAVEIKVLRSKLATPGLIPRPVRRVSQTLQMQTRFVADSHLKCSTWMEDSGGRRSGQKAGEGRSQAWRRRRPSTATQAIFTGLQGPYWRPVMMFGIALIVAGFGFMTVLLIRLRMFLNSEGDVEEYRDIFGKVRTRPRASPPNPRATGQEKLAESQQTSQPKASGWKGLWGRIRHPKLKGRDHRSG